MVTMIILNTITSFEKKIVYLIIVESYLYVRFIYYLPLTCLVMSALSVCVSVMFYVNEKNAKIIFLFIYLQNKQLHEFKTILDEKIPS